MKYVILDEVAFTENELDFLRMEGVITIVKQEIETSELEEKIVKKNLRPWKMWVVFHFGLNLSFIQIFR